MYFGPSSDIADLSLYQNRRVYCFECLDGLLGLTHILFKRQRGKVKDNRVKSSLCSFHRFHEGMRMVCIKKNGKIEFLAQTSHQYRDLRDSHKPTLALGYTNQNWNLELLRGDKDGLQ